MYMLYSLPSFVAALMLLTLFYQKLRGTGWELPLQGMISSNYAEMSPLGKADRYRPPPDLAARLLHLRQPRLRQPLHQSQHGRGPAAGLHPHGPGQRGRLLADHRRPRLPQHADSVRHAARPLAAGLAQRARSSWKAFSAGPAWGSCSSSPIGRRDYDVDHGPDADVHDAHARSASSWPTFSTPSSIPASPIANDEPADPASRSDLPLASIEPAPAPMPTAAAPRDSARAAPRLLGRCLAALPPQARRRCSPWSTCVAARHRRPRRTGHRRHQARSSATTRAASTFPAWAICIRGWRTRSSAATGSAIRSTSRCRKRTRTVGPSIRSSIRTPSAASARKRSMACVRRSGSRRLAAPAHNPAEASPPQPSRMNPFGEPLASVGPRRPSFGEPPALVRASAIPAADRPR